MAASVGLLVDRFEPDHVGLPAAFGGARYEAVALGAFEEATTKDAQARD